MIDGITPLSKSQRNMTHKTCRKCNKSLPILNRGFYCPACKKIAKKERSLGRKLTSLDFGA